MAEVTVIAIGEAGVSVAARWVGGGFIVSFKGTGGTHVNPASPS